MSSIESEIEETARWFASPRFEGPTRLHSVRQVVEQRGTIQQDYTVARTAAEQFYDRLRELFAQRKHITTFGPYSPGQAVAMKRVGIGSTSGVGRPQPRDRPPRIPGPTWPAIP